VENSQKPALVLELGFNWIRHFDPRQGGHLLRRLKGLRLKTARQYRCKIAPVVVRSNLQLPPNAFRFIADGYITEKGWAPADFLMLMDQGDREHEMLTMPGYVIFFEPMRNQRVILIKREIPPNLIPADLQIVEPGDVLLQYARRALEIEALFNAH
jgi:flagellar biosynthesis component FlhA